MQLAVDEAWKYQFLTYPNPTVGACVVKNNQVLAVDAHKFAGGPHAEVEALKKAYLKNYPNSQLSKLTLSKDIHNFLYENHNGFFYDCEIYVTLEPCNHTGKTPACSSLIEKLRLKKVYIGTLDPNKKASGGLQRLKKANIDVDTDILKEQTDNLLFPFKVWQEGSFRVFKLAMREDGSVDGGYITTNDSLKLVHKIRTKLDLMVIGGDTVRQDRPTLDARFAKINKAPDIMIYSKYKKHQFDESIPLFSVKNRKVNVCDDLKIIKDKNFVMIEGGKRLLKILKNEIDMLMLFISHKNKTKTPYNLQNLNMEKVHSYFINEYDEVVFFK